MPIISVCGEMVEVSWVSDYARGPDGRCAFCHGDSCAEKSGEDTPIGRYFKENEEWAETCPCCDGRPS